MKLSSNKEYFIQAMCVLRVRQLAWVAFFITKLPFILKRTKDVTCQMH